jgi:RNA polymerase primary sigma factor
MNQWEFAFEPSAWELIFDQLKPGTSFSASRFLSLMEPEGEEAVEAALEQLIQKDILLDIADLPPFFGSGEAAIRLRREAQLVKEGKLPEALEDNDPLRLYLEELASVPVCGDVRLLSERCLEGNEQAMTMLTNLMLSRVISRAYELAGRGVLLLDLIQEGSLGLWQAVLEYHGGDFESYCDRRIRMTLHQCLVLQAREAGVGQKMRQALEDYRAVDERLLSELGRNATLEEIALELHMSGDEAALVKETLDAARLVSSARNAEEAPEQTPEDDQAVEDTAYFQMRQRIADLLSGLSERDAKLLTLRFGLEGGKPLTPEQTGRQLGLTPEEVVAAEAAALAKLRNT